jgi:hypothetical protein
MSVNAGNVLKKLQEIKVNSSSGSDRVQAVVLNKCATSLAPNLSILFNSSLQQGSLPKGWKTAAVAPISKGGNKSDMENYRPISMTSLVGKTLEKLVRDRVQSFFDANNVIPDTQHGFRARRSCTTLLCKTLDKWASAVDQKSGAHVHAITLDWKKAFDRLLSKLSHYGIRGKMLKWIESFLTERTQIRFLSRRKVGASRRAVGRDSG